MSRSEAGPARPLGRKALSFGLIGVLNTGIDAGVFALLLAAGLAPVPANLLSWTCGALFSFAANRRFTFAPISGRLSGSLLRFLLAGAGSSLLASTLTLWLLADVLGVWPAKVLAIGAGAALGFLGAHWSIEGRLPGRLPRR